MIFSLLITNNNLLKEPFKSCKYLTSKKKMEKLYNNIFYLWKKL